MNGYGLSECFKLHHCLRSEKDLAKQIKDGILTGHENVTSMALIPQDLGTKAHDLMVDVLQSILPQLEKSSSLGVDPVKDQIVNPTSNNILHGDPPALEDHLLINICNIIDVPSSSSNPCVTNHNVTNLVVVFLDSNGTNKLLSHNLIDEQVVNLNSRDETNVGNELSYNMWKKKRPFLKWPIRQV